MNQGIVIGGIALGGLFLLSRSPVSRANATNLTTAQRQALLKNQQQQSMFAGLGSLLGGMLGTNKNQQQPQPKSSGGGSSGGSSGGGSGARGPCIGPAKNPCGTATACCEGESDLANVLSGPGCVPHDPCNPFGPGSNCANVTNVPCFDNSCISCNNTFCSACFAFTPCCL